MPETLSASHPKPFTWIATLLLALIAVGHVLRAAFAVEVVVGGTLIPVGASIPVVVVTGALAVMLWRESRG